MTARGWGAGPGPGWTSTRPGVSTVTHHWPHWQAGTQVGTQGAVALGLTRRGWPGTGTARVSCTRGQRRPGHPRLLHVHRDRHGDSTIWATSSRGCVAAAAEVQSGACGRGRGVAQQGREACPLCGCSHCAVNAAHAKWGGWRNAHPTLEAVPLGGGQVALADGAPHGHQLVIQTTDKVHTDSRSESKGTTTIRLGRVQS